jgi:hypothetical protein
MLGSGWYRGLQLMDVAIIIHLTLYFVDKDIA